MKFLIILYFILLFTNIETFIVGLDCNVGNGGCYPSAKCRKLDTGAVECTCQIGQTGNGAFCALPVAPNDTFCTSQTQVHCYRNCCPYHYNCAEGNLHPTYFRAMAPKTVCSGNKQVLPTQCTPPPGGCFEGIICGDGICDALEAIVGSEFYCGLDCGDVSCGDDVCTGGVENCANCPEDCGECIPTTTIPIPTTIIPTTSNPPFIPTLPVVCGDKKCERGIENCFTCSEDCGECPPCTDEPKKSKCGDNICDKNENCITCEIDCGQCRRLKGYKIIQNE